MRRSPDLRGGVGDLKADVDNMFGLDPLNDKFAEYQELLVINEKDRRRFHFLAGFDTGRLTRRLATKSLWIPLSSLMRMTSATLRKSRRRRSMSARLSQNMKTKFCFLSP